MIGTICLLACALAAPVTSASAAQEPQGTLEVLVAFPKSLRADPVDGRVLLLFSTSGEKEPRFQISGNVDSAQIFGVDVNGLSAGSTVRFDDAAFGYPLPKLSALPPGDYTVQAVLHVYETFRLAHGATVQLPMDRGEGQHWNLAPGNLYSTPQKVTIQTAGDARTITVEFDQIIAPIEPPKDTKYIRHVRIQSERLSEFWGRPMHLGAHVLVPEGFDEHPDARYPVMIFHGHFSSDFGGFRPEPPDPDLEPDFAARFGVAGYNRIQQQEAHDFYKLWTSDGFPRFLIVEIQHANPYYDDSYAVNSANLGPYGDAITYELLPHLEAQFRGIGKGWSRFLYGGSTGGWEALAVQVFYPDEYGGCFAACPDPIDFRAFCLVDLYGDENAYERRGPFGRIEIPAHRDSLGQVNGTMRMSNHMELALGTKSRSGDQFDIWEAVYSPVGPDGYPARIWDKLTGEIDPTVAAYWREHYDLRHILERDWATLGPKLAGKIHLYCGDMDNYYLNNAVYLMEDFLEKTTDPPYGGVVEYGDRAEHCWNGDHENGNHLSRLRYNTMYLRRILELIRENAPEDAALDFLGK
ncbi:hypothetical protein Poly30_32470 [Planctomycetes bacterium Poly30]|uniref:Esterase n=1 Tax=Saltatorellus ferox TaxID=2528018 RepID=A0A518EUD5_9BACT|nr:hypothetical protein Poly30_32470 [Planctomycetes bacterium Poly30]